MTVCRHVVYQTLTNSVPWSITDLNNSLEKSIVNQNVKKELSFGRNPKVYYLLNNSPVLIQINSSHSLSLSSCTFNTNYINVFHLHLVL